MARKGRKGNIIFKYNKIDAQISHGVLADECSDLNITKYGSANVITSQVHEPSKYFMLSELFCAGRPKMDIGKVIRYAGITMATSRT